MSKMGKKKESLCIKEALKQKGEKFYFKTQSTLGLGIFEKYAMLSYSSRLHISATMCSSPSVFRVCGSGLLVSLSQPISS